MFSLVTKLILLALVSLCIEAQYFGGDADRFGQIRLPNSRTRRQEQVESHEDIPEVRATARKSAAPEYSNTEDETEPESHEDIPEVRSPTEEEAVPGPSDVSQSESHEDIPEIRAINEELISRHRRQHEEDASYVEEEEEEEEEKSSEYVDTIPGIVEEVKASVDAPSDAEIARFNAQAAAPTEDAAGKDTHKLVPFDDSSSSKAGGQLQRGESNGQVAVPQAPAAPAAITTPAPFTFATFAPFTFPTHAPLPTVAPLGGAGASADLPTLATLPPFGAPHTLPPSVFATNGPPTPDPWAAYSLSTLFPLAATVEPVTIAGFPAQDYSYGYRRIEGQTYDGVAVGQPGNLLYVFCPNCFKKK
uniref:Uncharacterized protein n=1 Tax=Plectus sambesii TaxID=2011161 RepID=A0A914XKM6_9BILA